MYNSSALQLGKLYLPTSELERHLSTAKKLKSNLKGDFVGHYAFSFLWLMEYFQIVFKIQSRYEKFPDRNLSKSEAKLKKHILKYGQYISISRSDIPSSVTGHNIYFSSTMIDEFILDTPVNDEVPTSERAISAAQLASISNLCDVINLYKGFNHWLDKALTELIVCLEELV
ncbi:MAG: hypothetical protein ACRCXZ_10170 [Patescibacteria group bacterium]